MEVTTLKGGTWGSSSRRKTLLGQTVAVRERRVVRADGEAAGGVELGRDPQEDSFRCRKHRSLGGSSLGDFRVNHPELRSRGHQGTWTRMVEWVLTG